MKSCKSHEKKWNKEHQTLSFQFFINRSSILMFFVLFLMWFARFQILIYEPQSIWHKFLVLSWLYLLLLFLPIWFVETCLDRVGQSSQSKISKCVDILWTDVGSMIIQHTLKLAAPDRLPLLWNLEPHNNVNYCTPQ